MIFKNTGDKGLYLADSNSNSLHHGTSKI